MKNSEQEFSLQQLEMAIDAARMCGAGCFSVQDVLAKLPGAKKDAVLENRILRMLDADEALFRDDEDVFCGKAEFFTGKTFLITPDSFEISQGILVPGHRTVAFVSPEVFPSEVEMTDGESQNIFEMKDFSADLDMIYNYYLLLGSEQLMDYLTADHPAFVRKFFEPPQEVFSTRLPPLPFSAAPLRCRRPLFQLPFALLSRRHRVSR